jgi:hypothetical protein
MYLQKVLSKKNYYLCDILKITAENSRILIRIRIQIH